MNSSVNRTVCIVMAISLIIGRRLTLFHGKQGMLLLLGLVFAFLTFQIVLSLKTGRVGLWPGGAATREGRPQVFWRHIYTDCAFLVALAGVSLWVLLSPATFGD